MRDRDLRASLAARGPIHQAYSYAGELIDGRRRKAFCDELGLKLEVHECATLHEACSTLFVLHPERALELARRESTSSLLELAELCGTTAVAIARHVSSPKKSHKSATKEALAKARSSSRMLRRLVTFEPELYELAKRAATELGHRNVNKFVRDSVWRSVRDLELNGAPRHQPHRVQAPHGARRRAS